MRIAPDIDQTGPGMAETVLWSEAAGTIPEMGNFVPGRTVMKLNCHQKENFCLERLKFTEKRLKKF